jgi:plastocyanin
VKARWLVLALLAGLAVPFVVPALAADQSVKATVFSQFDPENVAVKPGEKVTFSNEGGKHNVVWDDGQEPPEPATPEFPNEGWTADRTFASEGTYRYYCAEHGAPGGIGMSGVVYVNAAGTVPTGTQTQPTNTGTTPTNTGTTPTNTSTTPTNTTGTTTGTGGGDAGSDTTAPTVASLRAGAASFCTRRSRTCRRPGLVFRLRLSEAARLRGVVQRIGGARGSATRRNVSVAGKPGQNTIRVSARGLVPGRYRLTLRAIDAAGNTSAAVRTTFKLRR